MELKDKVAVITGASNGIGLATARALHREGVKLALAARSEDKLLALAQELPGSLVITADLSKKDDVKTMITKAVKHFGRIDILVNNAGVGYDAPLTKISLQKFQYVFDLDLVAPLLAMQQVIPLMQKQGGGTIVNVSSGLALFEMANTAAYASLKAALATMSRITAAEVKKDNITISVMYPFMTDTDFEKNTLKEEYESTWEGGDGEAPKADPPELIADQIVAGIKSGAAAIYAHDWMEPGKGKKLE